MTFARLKPGAKRSWSLRLTSGERRKLARARGRRLSATLTVTPKGQPAVRRRVVLRG